MNESMKVKMFRKRASTSGSDESNGSNLPKKRSAVWDPYCWICHRDNTNHRCSTCIRSYHSQCIGLNVDKEPLLSYRCELCKRTEAAEEQYKNRDKNKMHQMLAFLVKDLSSDEDFSQFGVEFGNKRQPTVPGPAIINPFHLEIISEKVEESMYKSPLEFMNDIRTIRHNAEIVLKKTDDLHKYAGCMERLADKEIYDMEMCGECYRRANTEREWFTRICNPPHLLIWAKAKGHPYWPAKVLGISDVHNKKLDIRFFGKHEMYNVSPADCLLFCDDDPNNKELDDDEMGKFYAALKEANKYIKNLEEAFKCDLVLADLKTPLDIKKIDKYLATMIPGFDPVDFKLKQKPEFLKKIRYPKAAKQIEPKTVDKRMFDCHVQVDRCDKDLSAELLHELHTKWSTAPERQIVDRQPENELVINDRPIEVVAKTESEKEHIRQSIEFIKTHDLIVNLVSENESETDSGYYVISSDSEDEADQQIPSVETIDDESNVTQPDKATVVEGSEVFFIDTDSEDELHVKKSSNQQTYRNPNKMMARKSYVSPHNRRFALRKKPVEATAQMPGRELTDTKVEACEQFNNIVMIVAEPIQTDEVIECTSNEAVETEAIQIAEVDNTKHDDVEMNDINKNAEGEKDMETTQTDTQDVDCIEENDGNQNIEETVQQNEELLAEETSEIIDTDEPMEENGPIPVEQGQDTNESNAQTSNENDTTLVMDSNSNEKVEGQNEKDTVNSALVEMDQVIAEEKSTQITDPNSPSNLKTQTIHEHVESEYRSESTQTEEDANQVDMVMLREEINIQQDAIRLLQEEITKKDDQLSKIGDELIIKDLELIKKEKELKNMVNQLQIKDDELLKKQEELTKKDDELMKIRQELIEKIEELNSKFNELRKKDEELSLKYDEINQKDKELNVKHVELNEIQAQHRIEIEQLHEKLKQKIQEIAELKIQRIIETPAQGEQCIKLCTMCKKVANFEFSKRYPPPTCSLACLTALYLTAAPTQSIDHIMPTHQEEGPIGENLQASTDTGGPLNMEIAANEDALIPSGAPEFFV